MADVTEASPHAQRGERLQLASRPRLEPRPLDEAVYARAQAEGLNELQARLLASRLPGYQGELAPLVSPSLRYLAHPQKLADGQRAAERIAQAVAEGESIGILTDYDVDGITSRGDPAHPGGAVWRTGTQTA